MTATIKYDRTVSNFIDQLSATGHVTHTAYKKTSVTLHHNGGRLSHQGVLNVWKTRPASAHFDVDSSGAVAQYVKVNEYAWAVGNGEGNRTSISIEMANATLAPGWTVADSTWKGAARLAGWLFFKVIGARPTKSNFFYHHHWSATACAGPYMDKIYAKVLKAAQESYDSFKTEPKPSTPSTPAKKSNVEIAKEVIAGKWDNDPTRARRLREAGYSPNVIQLEVEKLLKKEPARKSIAQIAAEVIDGVWGSGVDRVTRLTKAGYNSNTVQKEVNRLLLGNSHAQKSINQLAAEVKLGKWGDGEVRVQRLTRAGYNAKAVQAEVNRRS